MKIPFTLDAWFKDKSQKVETRDGMLVHNIWRVKEPFYTNNRKAEVCVLIDGEEDALVFFEGGRYLPTTKDTDSPFDLFIVTPEPELTEFEKALENFLMNADSSEDTYHNDVKKHASKLLAIAKKELEKESPKWKPTEKQMDALIGANELLRFHGYDATATRILELYSDLKKLCRVN